MPDSLVFNVPVGALGIGATSVTGTLSLTYPTTFGGAVTATGTLNVGAVLGVVAAQSYSTFTVTTGGTASAPTYTITAVSSTGLTDLSVTYSGMLPTTTTSATVTTAVGGATLLSGSGGTVTSTPCFVSGTLIRTVEGDVAVENLQVGDLVVTADGRQSPVKWLDHRTVATRRYSAPHTVMPVRIGAEALGPNRPSRDLWVSPGHSICFDVAGEVLIPAIALVNGTTICQVEVDEVTYWHVELDAHDVIIAENQPAESYMDMGNRAFFVSNPVIGLDMAPDGISPGLRTHGDFCRPFHDYGLVVDSVRSLVEEREASLRRRRLYEREATAA